MYAPKPQAELSPVWASLSHVVIVVLGAHSVGCKGVVWRIGAGQDSGSLAWKDGAERVGIQDCVDVHFACVYKHVGGARAALGFA